MEKSTHVTEMVAGAGHELQPESYPEPEANSEARAVTRPADLPQQGSQKRSEPPAPGSFACRVIAVVNQKGGVGKTTTAINLATALAMEGLPTLLLDCDPQANTTGGLGFGRDDARASIYDLLMANPQDGPGEGDPADTETDKETDKETDGANGPAASPDANLDEPHESISLAAITLPTAVEGLFLVPGSKNLIGANLELVALDRREFRLRDAIAPARPQYPYIILDCPPALDLLTLNALVAADGLLVPMQAEYFALEGISELMNTLDRVSQAFNPALALAGVLLTMYDDRTNLSQQVTENLKAFFGDKLFKTTIPRNIRLAEAPSHGKPVALYDPRSRGAEAYQELALELLARDGVESPKQKQRKAGSAAPAREIRFWPYNK
jgi:chromosome partitioning protein